MSTSPIKSRGLAFWAFIQRDRTLLAFASKMALVYGLWFVLYDLWLAPDGRLDAWLAEGTASLSSRLLSLSGFETFAVRRSPLGDWRWDWPGATWNFSSMISAEPCFPGRQFRRPTVDVMAWRGCCGRRSMMQEEKSRASIFRDRHRPARKIPSLI